MDGTALPGLKRGAFWDPFSYLPHLALTRLPSLTPRLQRLPAAARRQSKAPRTASPLVASARTRPSAQDGRLPSGLPGSRSTEGPTDPSVCSGDTSSTAGAPAAPDPGLTMDLLTD